MPAKPVDQLAMDERIVADDALEASLEARFKAKNALNALQAQFNEADEDAIGKIAALDLAIGEVVRVGRFRIEKAATKPHTVESFDVKGGTRIKIEAGDDE